MCGKCESQSASVQCAETRLANEWRQLTRQLTPRPQREFDGVARVAMVLDKSLAN